MNSFLVRKFATITFVLSYIVFISSCQTNNETKEDVSKVEEVVYQDSTSIVEEEEVDSIYIDTFFTNIALTIGGIDNPFIQKRGLVSNYGALVKNQFDYFERTKLNPITKWVQDQTIIPEKYKTNTLFYPFAGADFVYANAFYSNVKNYILVGLEKPGYLPNYDQLDNVALQNYLSQIFNSLDVSMKSGFFRTNSMAVQFNQKTVNGTLHSLLFYLARTGNKIRKLDHFILKENSELKYTFGTEAMFSPGLDIEFLTQDNKVKHVYYYNIDLSDSNTEISNFFGWVDSFGEHSSMLKAASYLNSREYFSNTRNYLLTKSKMIIQDDSGIPYSYFNNSDWKVNLYGSYTKVIRLFSSRLQADMVKAYADTNRLTSSHLPFKIGYNVSVGETNLQVLYKK